MAELSKTEFLKLVDAYFGAKDHERWVYANGTASEYRLAVAATEKARQATIEGVSP